MNRPTNDPLLIYGGTFDPVHRGHVAVARAAADQLGISRALLIPAGDPPHRGAPRASAKDRAAMLRLAFADDPRFVVDEREIRRNGPSYMADTLADLRGEHGAATPLILLLGADAYRGLTTWHRWRDLAGYAHFAVFPRPGIALDPHADDWPPDLPAPVDDPASLRDAPAGRGATLAAPVSTESSTAIRAALARGDLPRGLPSAVAAYIAEHGCYRR